jgi:hypothetical protein
MIAKRVMVEFPFSKKKSISYENVVLFSDEYNLHVNTREIEESFVINNLEFYSISKEWISFTGLIMSSRFLFEKVEVHILQERSY